MPRLAILYSDSTKNQNWGKKTIVQPYVTLLQFNNNRGRDNGFNW